MTLLATAPTSLASSRGETSGASAERVGERLALPSAFVPNQGQHAEGVAYLARGLGLTVALAPDGSARLGSPGSGSPAVDLRLRGARQPRGSQGLEATPARNHFFLGNDPDRWRRDVPSFARVAFEEVYPGIDLEYHLPDGALRFDFVLEPGASPETLRFAFEAMIEPAKPLPVRVAADGALEVGLADGTDLRFTAPVAFQLGEAGEREIVGCRFALHDGREVGFELDAYDRSRPLRIDPTLLTSTFFGGSFADRIDDLHLDSAGNIVVTGYTGSEDFPVTAGVLQPVWADVWDLFVAKLDPTAQSLIYSTYLGGTGTDWEPSLAVDAAGHAYVTARSNSVDYPTRNPIQATNAGGYDLVVSKLTPSGDDLVYSTYLGGSEDDRILTLGVIAVGPDGRLYVGGYTTSNDFPVVNPYQASRIESTCTFSNGTSYPCRDLVLSVLAPDGASLEYSTYFGSSGDDVSPHLAVDGDGNLYFSIFTFAPDLPTVFAPQPELAGSSDIYVAKLRPDGSPPLFATYWGGSDCDGVWDIEVDSRGRVYVVGTVISSDFPTVEPLQSLIPTICGTEPDTYPCRDLAVVRFNPRGTAVEFSTPLGGSGSDSAAVIHVDSVGNISLAARTNSLDFPLVDPIQATAPGMDDITDGAVVVLRGSGRPEVLMATYLGGESLDWPFGVAADPLGVVTLGGNTDSEDFPIVNALQPIHGGHGFQLIVSDGFISRISPDKAVLALEQKVPAVLGEPVELPLSISPGGLEISSLAFSIDLPDCLDFDPTDGDADGIPDDFVLDLPPAFAASVTVDLGDTDGEIDGVVLDPAPPLASLPTSFLGSVIVTPTCLPAGGGREIELPFSGSPAPSFGTTTGSSGPGFGIDGSVILLEASRGDCNGDGHLDAGDISACVLEVFDDDGTFWLDTAGSTFAGLPLGCDANGDTVVDAGDLACKQLLIFEGPGACAGGSPFAEGDPPRVALVGPERGIVGEPVEVTAELDPAGSGVRSLVFALDIGPALALPDVDGDGDGLPDAVTSHLPAGFTLTATVHPERPFAELAVAVLPPADLGATLPPGPLFELVLEAATPVATSGLAPSRQLPLSAGDTEGRSLAGELEGLAIPIHAAGWLFGDGFESGAVDRWSASLP